MIYTEWKKKGEKVSFLLVVTRRRSILSRGEIRQVFDK